MDALKLRQIFEKLDQALEHPTELLIRGGAAVVLPRAVPERGYNTIFRGLRLTVRTPPAADLVIGKLKRLDTEDLADVTFLIRQFRLTEADLRESFGRLPERFKADLVVEDNLRFVIEDFL